MSGYDDGTTMWSSKRPPSKGVSTGPQITARQLLRFPSMGESWTSASGFFASFCCSRYSFIKRPAMTVTECLGRTHVRSTDSRITLTQHNVAFEQWDGGRCEPIVSLKAPSSSARTIPSILRRVQLHFYSILRISLHESSRMMFTAHMSHVTRVFMCTRYARCLAEDESMRDCCHASTQ